MAVFHNLRREARPLGRAVQAPASIGTRPPARPRSSPGPASAARTPSRRPRPPTKRLKAPDGLFGRVVPTPVAGPSRAIPSRLPPN